MSDADAQRTTGNARDTWIGLAMLAAAGVVLFFTAGFIFQAFKGPRPITEQELLQTANPGWGDNYVSYSPSRPVVDTNLQWGKKNNPGTKYLLLPVGDRLMLCSARIDDNGPKFVGRLETFGGSVEEEVIARVSAGNPGVRQQVTPIMFQTVRSIWVDTSVALVAVIALGLGGLWKVLHPFIVGRREPPSDAGLTT
jgi:hypothetical protein